MSAARAERPATLTSLSALFGLLVRMQVTVLRVLGIAALGAIAVVIALFARGDDDPLRATTEVAIGYGLGLVLPLATLWLATSSVGDLIDDRLLVYLWLKPVARWQLPLAAVLATVTVVVPLVAVPLVAAAAVGTAAELVGAVLAACLLGVVAYAGAFVAAAFWLRRALWWGLLYVLVWENGLARAVDGAARLSIAGYAQSLVARSAGIDIAYADRSTAAAVAVPLGVAVVGLALACRRYARAEVD